MPDEEKVQVELTTAEALVLFEWLVRSDEKLAATFEDQAEQRVLWDIEAMLERALVRTSGSELHGAAGRGKTPSAGF